MAENQELKGIASMSPDEQTEAWMEEHLPELRQSFQGSAFCTRALSSVSWSVWLLMWGDTCSYRRRRAGYSELMADLLHALGWSLWTGAVVTVFVQILPEVKRRQIKQSVDAYEALRREKAQAAGNRDRAVLERPDGRRAARKQGQTRPRNRARKGDK